jgi:alkanesulfonate monooxygenase SsuD/methylene tetrahydromethanopterin reductase-like flavin-dependent oxidoreductase (luciferase family)
VIIGGGGPKRTPALAARFADEFNAPFSRPERVAEMNANVSRACEEAGRDPATLRRSTATTICCGRDDAEIARRAAALGREVDELRASSACGTPGEVVARLGEFASAGAECAYLQVMDLDDLEHIRLLGTEVLPAVAGI